MEAKEGEEQDLSEDRICRSQGLAMNKERKVGIFKMKKRERGNRLLLWRMKESVEGYLFKGEKRIGFLFQRSLACPSPCKGTPFKPLERTQDEIGNLPPSSKGIISCAVGPRCIISTPMGI